MGGTFVVTDRDRRLVYPAGVFWGLHGTHPRRVRGGSGHGIGGKAGKGATVSVFSGAGADKVGDLGDVAHLGLHAGNQRPCPALALPDLDQPWLDQPELTQPELTQPKLAPRDATPRDATLPSLSQPYTALPCPVSPGGEVNPRA